MGSTSDIAVLGSGPAALSIGAAAARLGCQVTLIAPDPHATWAPNYCVWEDEVPAGAQGAVGHRWSEVLVATPGGERSLSRPYVKLDGRALSESCWSALGKASCRVVRGRAVSLRHEPDITTVFTAEGDSEQARVVVDASGATTPFVARSSNRAPAFQAAYGLLLDAPSHRFDRDRAVLMDFRPAEGDALEPPSFLYVLPLDDKLFVEETSLAHRPAVSFELLRARLQRRLASWGLHQCNVLGEEHCTIPMGVPLPSVQQEVVPYGAAASMVNPASGYSIAHALRKAEPTARSIVHALASGGRREAIAEGNAAVWPSSDRAAWELYAIGLESLVDMDAAQTSAFFSGFFQMAEEDWAGFLAGTLTAREVGMIMARVFRFVPPSVRWHLVRTSFSQGITPFAKLFLQPGTA